MASISFGAKPQTRKEEPEAAKESLRDKEEVSTSLATIDQNQGQVVSINGVRGEISMKDIKLPRINLVQKVGGLGDIFAPGSIVFEKQIVLSNGKQPVNLTPLQIHKQYQKKITWGAGDSNEQAEVYNSAKEVREAGGSLEYGDENYFQEIAHIQFAVQLPEHVEGDEALDLFPYKFNDALYTMAMWTVASSSYTALAKPIFSAAAAGPLRNGLEQGSFNVTSELRKNAMNSWHAPKATFAGKHTPEAVAFFRELMGL
jgi:hypothetical protein